jgi:hypothetical protein
VDQEGAAVGAMIARILNGCLCGLVLAGGAQAFEVDDARLKQCPGLEEWLAQNPAGVQSRSPVTTASQASLQARILRMAAEDQEVRNRFIASQGTADEKKTVNEMNAVDRTNLRALRKIVATHGVPTPHTIGENGMEAFWTLVQHGDLPLQAKMLRAFKTRDSGIPAKDLALLEDRVLVNQTRPQVYGSQFYPLGDDMVPYTIEDPIHVDERRQAMNLMPLAMYKCWLMIMYHPDKPAAGDDHAPQ